MRPILFLAYHFPPIGGAGVQRSVKFARYLPDLGYEPIVVTGPEVRSDPWTPEDESLLGELRPETRVLRLRTPPPALSFGWRDRAERWLGATDPFRAWWVNGVVDIGSAEDVQLVYASMSPFESGRAAAELGRRLGKPWVADLRDPWALDEMQAYPTRLHRWLESHRMRSLLSTAAAIVMNTEESARLVRSFRELAQKPVFTIPNGFDPDDFTGPDPHRADGNFRIVHTGYLHTETGERNRARSPIRRLLGGAIPGVNVLTRSHVYLLEAIDRLIARDPTVASTLELHLAGALSTTDLEAAARSPVVRTPGYLVHSDTISLLRSADLLFLPMHDVAPGTRARIVPGKTYEYLASGRPILAAVPEGDARDLLARAGTAYLCRPDDVDTMTEAIATEWTRVRTGRQAAVLNANVVYPYERQALTRDLANVFDLVLDGRPRLTER